MIHSQNTNSHVLIVPVSVSSQTIVSGTVDTLGWDYAVFQAIQDTAAGTANNPITWRLGEGSATSSFATWTEAVGDGTGGFTIGTVSTSLGNIHEIQVNLVPRMRYIQAELMSGGATTLSCCTVTFYRGKEPPTTAADKGLATFAIA